MSDLASSQSSLSLVTLPIFPVWLLVNRCFIKAILVTNLYRVQERYPTAQGWSLEWRVGAVSLVVEQISLEGSSVCLYPGEGV